MNYCKPTTHKHCVGCNQTLSVKNKASDDQYAAYCKQCWSSFEEWEPKCSTCGTELEQDILNLFLISCSKGCCQLSLTRVQSLEGASN